MKTIKSLVKFRINLRRSKRSFKKIFSKQNFILLGLFLIGVYIAGFIFFYHKTPSNFRKEPKVRSYDAVVVFTGEEYRITEGLNLYNNNVAPYLYISGIYKKMPNRYFYSLLRRKGYNANYINMNDIYFDNYAENTIENVISTNNFLKKIRAKNVLIITSGYHIIRAKFLTKFFIKGAKVRFYPVFRKRRNSKYSVEFLTKSFVEYNKTLVYIMWVFLGMENHYFAHQK